MPSKSPWSEGVSAPRFGSTVGRDFVTVPKPIASPLWLGIGNDLEVLVPKPGTWHGHPRMRVIARSTIEDFLESLERTKDYQAVRNAFDAWQAEVKAAHWRNWAEVKSKYANASLVGERIVFNVKGNAYRVIVQPKFSAGLIFVIWIGTHRAYDQIDVKTVRFKKRARQ